MPPAPASPCAQKPAATQKPRTSVGPRMNSPSGRERLRAVDEPDTSASASIGTRTIAFSISSWKRSQSSSSSRPLKSGGMPSRPHGAGLPLVAAHHQAAGLAAEVDEQRRVAHRRQLERQVGRARDQVLVRHRDHRDDDAGERADLGGEHPAGVDDDLGLDAAPVGLDRLDPAALDLDPGHPRVRLDLGAAAPGALGEREGELARVDVAVGGEVGGAEDAVGRHRREEPLRLLRRDQLEREAERLRPAGLARELLHALLRGGEPQRADLVPAGLEPDLVAERPVQLDRAHHHLRQAQRAAQLADEAGGVERRAARQVGALDEHDVVPAELRQPVEDGAAADAAADHDDPGPVPHESARSKCWFA